MFIQNQERKKQPYLVENVFFCNWKQTSLMALTAACQHGLRSRQAQTFFEINFPYSSVSILGQIINPGIKEQINKFQLSLGFLSPTPAKLDSEAEVTQKAGLPGVQVKPPSGRKEGAVVD